MQRKSEKELKVIASFSSDKEQNVIAEAHLCVRQDRTVTIKIVKGKLSAQKVDAIVIPTGRSTSTDYPIEYHNLATQSYQDGYSEVLHNPCRLEELGQTSILDGGKLPCQHIVHTLAPIQWGNRDAKRESIRNSLSRASSAKLTSLAFPDMTTQMIQWIVDALTEMKSNEAIVSVSVVTSTKNQSDVYARALTSITAPTCYKWSWENDVGSHSPYSPGAIDTLNDAYIRDPNGTCSLKVGQQDYSINFKIMTQINVLTQFQRRIKKEAIRNTVIWQYRDDHGCFTQYSSEDSELIESMLKSKYSTRQGILSNGREYKLDFDNMYQINVNSGFTRDISRRKSKFLSDDLLVTLKGPAKSLVKAEEKIHDELKTHLFSENMNLPHNSPPSLHQKFNSIAKKHQVSIIRNTDELEASPVTQNIITIQGLKELVNQSVTEIQAEIISFLDSQRNIPNFEQTIYPSEWKPHLSNEQYKFIPLSRNSSEFEGVSERMRSTLPNLTISKIDRVQNKWLWESYVLKKKRLHEKNAGKVGEEQLFHGAKHTSAKDICASETGLDMRHSREGLWGRANYFAVDAIYSDTYAHPTDGEFKEIILFKVLTGDSFKSPPDNTLRYPPEKPNIDGELRVRYDTVNGVTQGYTVYMTYDNEHAYPAYIITYKYSINAYSVFGYQPQPLMARPTHTNVPPPVKSPPPAPKPPPSTASSCTIS